MGWIRFDDHFDEHPKIAQLSDTALALWMTSLAYSNRNLTDGFIPYQVGLGQLRYCGGNTTPPIRELERAELWVEVDGGWLIHDYLDYQPSRADIEARRADLHGKRSVAGRKGAEKRWNKSPAQDGNDGNPIPNAKQTAKQTDRQTDGPNPKPVIPPLTTFEVTRPPEIDIEVLDEERSDLATGLLVFCSPETGKQVRRVDGLWDTAAEIWGTPRTKTERGRRNREIAELRDAGVHPDQLRPLLEKAVIRWNGRARPGLAGIIRNLGDLMEGFDMPAPSALTHLDRERERRARRAQITGATS